MSNLTSPLFLQISIFIFPRACPNPDFQARLAPLFIATTCVYSTLASPQRYVAVDRVDAPCPHLKINRTRSR